MWPRVLTVGDPLHPAAPDDINKIQYTWTPGMVGMKREQNAASWGKDQQTWSVMVSGQLGGSG